MNFYPIINRHAAWLVANPIQGCPNNENVKLFL